MNALARLAGALSLAAGGAIGAWRGRSLSRVWVALADLDARLSTLAAREQATQAKLDALGDKITSTAEEVQALRRPSYPETQSPPRGVEAMAVAQGTQARLLNETMQRVAVLEHMGPRSGR